MEIITEISAISCLDHACKLEHKTIGEIRGSFFVPGYQRGYRWDKDDVTRLLDDIWASEGNDYSLQPIVVKLHKKAEHGTKEEWELIDGQQRLTTLYLILHYIQKQGWKKMGAPYTLRYETREGSQNYLDSLDANLSEKNIDFFHIYQAHQCIETWFRKHGDEYNQEDAASSLHSYLFKSVRVIWYSAPAETIATELFTRLNIGRIPLTDAELIKAALLSEVRRIFKDRTIEIAAQWDSIERDLHRADIWAFVAGLSTSEDDEKYPTRISLLLDTLADEKVLPSGKRPRYHTFDTLRCEIELNFSDFWMRVLALHAQILGWAEQPKIYNKIGFLIASGYTFGKINDGAQKKKKSEFDAFLITKIRTLLNIKNEGLEELSYEKKADYTKLLQLLFLMNVETMTQSGNRFPFALHVGKKWSLEHIHAQNAETLNKAEQWNAWLMHHKAALDAVTSELNIDQITILKIEVDAAIANINSGRSGNFSGEKFNAISARLLTILDRDGSPDHSIRNMALLSSDDNSSLNNSVFEVKRRMILELDRKGNYVPVCTRNIFLKYYADADPQQAHFWSETDKNSYFKEASNKLKPYFIDFDKN